MSEMKRITGFALMAMVLSAVGAPVRGQFSPGRAANSEYEIQQTRIRLQQAEAEWTAATKAFEEKKSAVDRGVAPQSDLTAAASERMRAQSSVELLRNQLSRQEAAQRTDDRISALQRPVTVELRDSPVRQAAQTLSQASGISISVDKDIPADKRLTVVAQRVPLATVLDTIARQTGLLIAPEGNGVLLKPVPSLEVNGQRAEIMSAFAPWSSEWGTNPAANLGELGGYHTVTYPLAEGGHVYRVVPATPSDVLGQLPSSGQRPPTPYVQTPNGAPMPTAPDGSILYGAPRPAAPAPRNVRPGLPGTPGPGDLYGSPGGFGGFGGGYGFAASGPPPVTMTALSSTTFVVANPAAGPGGEPAVMLTVYRLEGAELRKVSSTLHRLGPSGARRGAVGYGSPGMFGQGGLGGYGGGGFGGGPGGFGGGGAGGFGGGPGGFGGGGAGGFFGGDLRGLPAPETSPKGAPENSPFTPLPAPRSSLEPKTAPAPSRSAPLFRPDVPRVPAAGDTVPLPALPPPAESPGQGR
jgi:hypothetical protein